MINNCWNADEKKRPTFRAIVDFFKGFKYLDETF